MARPKNFIDYTNTRVGKLFLTEYAGNRKWFCVCDCGFRFKVDIASVRSQNQSRCRYCYYKDKKKHGLSGTPEYQAWKHIKERCYDINDRMYPNYGARGIKMCDRWLGENGALNFVEDVGKRPTNKHSIDRINVDGNYEPANVRWATKHEQMRNRTNNIFITYNGETMILSDWAKVSGISASCIKARIDSNWDIKKALTTPSRNKKLCNNDNTN